MNRSGVNVTYLLDTRHVLFSIVCVVVTFMVYSPLKIILSSADHSEYYSHIIFIPLISLYFIYKNRSLYFKSCEHSIACGVPLMVVGILVYYLGKSAIFELNQNDSLSLTTFGAVVLVNGSFLFFYGYRSFKAALFPLLFLIFIIPLPSVFMESIISFLQRGSTEFSYLLFQLSGIPFFREGYVFHLPAISIEVAKQCSGIRSSLAFLITGVLAGYVFLDTWWKKSILVLCIIPITMVKNGFRILTLSLLGVYVNPKFLTDSVLHSDGGILFFIAGLLLLAPILHLFRKSDKRKGRRSA